MKHKLLRNIDLAIQLTEGAQTKVLAEVHCITTQAVTDRSNKAALKAHMWYSARKSKIPSLSDNGHHTLSRRKDKDLWIKILTEYKTFVLSETAELLSLGVLRHKSTNTALIISSSNPIIGSDIQRIIKNNVNRLNRMSNHSRTVGSVEKTQFALTHRPFHYEDFELIEIENNVSTRNHLSTAIEHKCKKARTKGMVTINSELRLRK